MLEEHKHRRWTGTYDLAFDHHFTHESLESSAKINCCICRVVLAKFKSRPHAEYDPLPSKVVAEKKAPAFTRASLLYARQWKAYRLDVKMNEVYDSELVGSFMLEELCMSLHPSFYKSN